MDVYSLWPGLACLGLVIALAATPAFRAIDPPGEASVGTGRLATLDGLRGLLALGVFFAHASVYHLFLLDGRWWTPSVAYGLLGQGGVSLFFMVTGFLFWSRLIREGGRPDWVALYVVRLFRIGPVYYIAIGGMLLGTAVETGFQLVVDLPTLALELLAWSAMGVSAAPVNGFGAWLLLAGVTWSLRYEWFFYASLLPLSWFARAPGRHLPCAMILVCGSAGLAVLEPAPGTGLPRESVCALLFSLGMLTASLQATGYAAGTIWRLSDGVASLVIVAVLGVFPEAFPDAYNVAPALALGVVFHLIAGGCSMFGLLRTRPLRRLGDISYGIYLLQGLALAVVMRPAPLRAVALSSPAGHWAMVAAACVLLVVMAAVVHVVVERPGIRLGRRVVRDWLRRTSPRRISPAAPT